MATSNESERDIIRTNWVASQPTHQAASEKLKRLEAAYAKILTQPEGSASQFLNKLAVAKDNLLRAESECKRLEASLREAFEFDAHWARFQ